MSDSPQEPGGRAIWRAIFFILLGFSVLACLFWLALDLASKKGLLRYERQQDFNFADFIPKPVQDESNFALVPVVGSRMEIYDGGSQIKTPDNGNWQIGQPTDLKAFQDYYRALATNANGFPVADERQSPAADVLFALSKYDVTIEELRQAATLPESRFPLKYDSPSPAAIMLPHLAVLKGSSQVLELRAVAELQDGQSDKAVADVKVMFRLVSSIRNEPFLISHLVRIAMLNRAIQPIWEGTQEHLWSDGQLKELDRDLAGLDFLADYEFSMRGQCACEIANIEFLRRTRSVAGLFDGSMPPAIEIELRLAPDFIYYHNELLVARAVQDWILPIADVERHSVSLADADAAVTNIDGICARPALNNVLAAMTLPVYEKIVERFSRAQSWVDLARIAVALERYRLAHGKYPDSLNALAPGFIESVPSDIIGGKPLIYHRSADGRYALYSVGWNGTDDGGKVIFHGGSKTQIDYDKGDWVWAGQVIGP